MSKKKKPLKKPCKCKEHEEHYPIYVQSSNPSTKLLEWMAEMSKHAIVYFQSGNPNPPKCPPSNPNCNNP